MLSIYDRLQIWAIRSQGTLGKQMYNKILNLALEDIDRLKEIQLFIGALVTVSEDQEFQEDFKQFMKGE
jgi:hypothetical protein